MSRERERVTESERESKQHYDNHRHFHKFPNKTKAKSEFTVSALFYAYLNTRNAKRKLGDYRAYPAHHEGYIS